MPVTGQAAERRRGSKRAVGPGCVHCHSIPGRHHDFLIRQSFRIPYARMKSTFFYLFKGNLIILNSKVVQKCQFLDGQSYANFYIVLLSTEWFVIQFTWDVVQLCSTKHKGNISSKGIVKVLRLLKTKWPLCVHTTIVVRVFSKLFVKGTWLYLS